MSLGRRISRFAQRVLSLAWRVFRIGSIVLLVFVVLLIGIVAFLTQTNPGRAFAIEQIESYLNRSVLTGRVEVGELNGNVFKRIGLADLTIYDLDDEVVLSLGEIEIEYELWPLLGLDVNVTSVVVRDLEVNGVIDELGNINLAQLTQPSEDPQQTSGPGPHVRAPDIVIENVDFDLRDMRNEGARLFIIEDLNAELGFEMWPDGEMVARVAHLDGLVAPPTDLEARYTLRVDELVAEIAGLVTAVEVGSVGIEESQLEDVVAFIKTSEDPDQAFDEVLVELPDVVVQPEDVNDLIDGVDLLTALTIRTRISGPPDALTLESTVEGDVGEVFASLVLDITDPTTPGYAGRVSVARFRPEQWITLEGISADVSFDVEVFGRGITPADATGGLRVDLGPSSALDFGVEGGYISLDYREGQVTLNEARAWYRGAEVKAAAFANLSGDFGLDLDLHVGQVGEFKVLVPDVRAPRGEVSLALETTGHLPPDELETLTERPPLEMAEYVLGRVSLYMDLEIEDAGADGHSLDTLRVIGEIPEQQRTDSRLTVDLRDATIDGVTTLRASYLDVSYRDETVNIESRILEAGTGRRANGRVEVRYEPGLVRATIREFEALADGVDASLDSQPTLRVAVDDEFMPQRINLPPTVLRVQGEEIRVSGEYDLSGSFDGRVSTGQLNLDKLTVLVPGVPRVSGFLMVDASARGTLASPSGSVVLELTNVGYGPVSDVDARLQATYAPGRLDIDHQLSLNNRPIVELDTGELGLPVTVNGETGAYSIDWNDPVDLTAMVRKIDFSMFHDAVPALSDFDARGVVDADLALSGTLANPQVNLSMELTRAGAVLVEGAAALDGIGMDLELEYADDRAHVTQEVTLDGARVLHFDTGEEGFPIAVDTRRGTYELRPEEPFEAHAEFAGLEIPVLYEALPQLEEMQVRGAVTGEAFVAGSLYDPRFDGELDASELAFVVEDSAGEPISVSGLELSATAHYDRAEEQSLDLGGELTWGGELLGSMSFVSDGDVRPLIEGTQEIDHWLLERFLEFDLELEPFDVSRLPQSILEMAGVESGTVATGIHWRGTPDRGAFDLVADVDRLVADALPLPVSVQAHAQAGQWTTQFEVVGSLGDLPIADVWEDDEAVDSEAEFFAEGAEVTALHAYGRWSEGLRGLLMEGISPTSPIELRLEMPRVALSQYMPPDAAGQEFPAIARGYVDVSGSLSDLELGGRWAVREIPTASNEFGMLGVELGFESGEFTLDAFSCDPEGQNMTTALSVRFPEALVGEYGELNIPDPADLSFSLDFTAADAPLAGLLPAPLIAGLLENVDGRLDAELHASGDLLNPTYEGELHLRDGEMGVIPLGRNIEELEIDASIENNGLQLTRLVIRDAGGRMNGEGEIGLVNNSLNDVNLTFRFREFLAADPTGAGVFLDGRVILTAVQAEEVLEGELVLRNLEVSIPDSGGGTYGATGIPGNIYFVGEDVLSSQVGEETPVLIGAELETGASAPFLADIQIITEGRNYVHHSLADVEYEVDLLAQLRDDEFRLFGDVTLPSGEVSFASKVFEIERGFITFDGQPNTINPVVDVRAVHYLSSEVTARLEPSSGSQASVSVVVNGELEELTDPESEAIDLQSDPGMSKEDIIMVLLTGRPRDEEADTEAQQQALATAGSLLLGLLGDRLAGGIPIDTLRIEGDSQSGQAISRVEGGKYISESLYVSGSYINSTDPEDNDFELALEWIIARFGSSASLRAQIRAGNRAKGGLELLYNLTRRGRNRYGDD